MGVRPSGESLRGLVKPLEKKGGKRIPVFQILDMTEIPEGADADDGLVIGLCVGRGTGRGIGGWNVEFEPITAIVAAFGVLGIAFVDVVVVLAVVVVVVVVGSTNSSNGSSCSGGTCSGTSGCADDGGLAV